MSRKQNVANSLDTNKTNLFAETSSSTGTLAVEFHVIEDVPQVETRLIKKLDEIKKEHGKDFSNITQLQSHLKKLKKG